MAEILVLSGPSLGQPVRLVTFPSIDYRDAWKWQHKTADAVRDGELETLALLQHTPVYTFGRLVRTKHLLITPGEISERGAVLVESDRGGDITFHGPGQLVGYPILDLHRRHLTPSAYVHALEETLMRAMSSFGLAPYRIHNRPGVWVHGAKLAAIGVRVQGGVTSHGFALNVHTDLSWFDAIVSCGISDASVTSMEQLLGAAPCFEAVEATVAAAFEEVFRSDLLRASVAPSTWIE